MVPLVVPETPENLHRVVIYAKNGIKIYVQEHAHEKYGVVYTVHSEVGPNGEQKSHETFVYLDENGQLQSFVRTDG